MAQSRAKRKRRRSRRDGSDLGRLVDRLLPRDLRNDSERRRGRVLVATSLLAIVTCLPVLVMRWISGVGMPELLHHAVLVFAFGSTPVLLRLTRSVAAAGTYMVAWGIVLTIFVALGYPGFEFVITGWFSVLAMVAVFFLGPRIGLALSGACMLGLAGMYFASDTGLAKFLLDAGGVAITEPQRRMLSLLNVELSIAMAATMAFIYNRELLRESESLQRRERDFRRLTDNLAVGVFVSRGGRIVHTNATGADLLGVRTRDAVGLDFTRELGLAVSSSTLRSSSEKGEVRETTFGARDGRTRVVELASMPIEWEGRFAILHTAFDLTERKWEAEERAKLEAQIRHTQKLETVGLLAGGIAHDFNNILQTILANTEMLQDRNGDADAPAAVGPGADDERDRDGRRLERIRLAATRGAELVDQMLAYAGRGQARIEEFEVSELAREVVSLASAAVSKKTDVVLELAANLPVVSADATQIRQVVMNLVTNAADAVGDEVGRVVVRTGEVTLRQLEARDVFVAGDLAPGRYVYLEVQDDGCGIEMSEVSKIFDPFFTTKTRGRGLGLAAVLGIVRAHGGTLEVESSPGVGARFRIYLPAVEGVQLRPRPASERLKAAPRSARVLLADDEVDILVSMRESLQARGYHVTTVADGVAAVDAVRSSAPAFDLVVLDMAMPRMDGAEALKAIHDIDPKLPAILSTGYAHGHQRLDLAGLGFSDMLRKPYRGRDLVRAIDRVLEGRSLPASRP